MNKDREINRHQWNVRTDAHFKHPDYKVREFLDGALTLHPLELKELTGVEGKTLLHLQCHFGLDTLSWARKGAIVTGIDISDNSIEMANELKDKAGLKARFIRSDLYDLPDILDEQFDIVFTSYGVTWWMNDINRWAEIAAKYVKKGGRFYMAESHPALDMFDENKLVFESYFHMGTERYKNETDYCDKDCNIEEEIGWRWSLGDIISALCRAGLKIEFLHEFPFSVYDKWSTMVEGEDGWWYYPDRKNDIPLTYSIMARKE